MERARMSVYRICMCVCEIMGMGQIVVPRRHYCGGSCIYSVKLADYLIKSTGANMEITQKCGKRDGRSAVLFNVFFLLLKLI